MYVYVCGGEQEVERTVDDPQQMEAVLNKLQTLQDAAISKGEFLLP
jgi:hypothetical protein